MKEETGYFSSLDGTHLFYRAWNKDTDACLIVIHGIGEHSGRYQEFAQELEGLAISVFCLDLRGHGHSDGARVYVNSFQDFVDDVEAFRNWIESHHKKQKFILLGQSLGGLILTSAVIKNQPHWQALVLMSPFFAVFRTHPILSVLALMLNCCLPKIVWNNPIQPDYLSHDDDEVRKYKDDRLIQRCITARLAHEMFRACSFVYHHAKEIRIPVLILASGDDRIVCLKATKNFYERISSKDKQLKVFEGSYHELLHERERGQAVELIKSFVVSRNSRRS